MQGQKKTYILTYSFQFFLIQLKENLVYVSTPQFLDLENEGRDFIFDRILSHHSNNFS